MYDKAVYEVPVKKGARGDLLNRGLLQSYEKNIHQENEHFKQYMHALG